MNLTVQQTWTGGGHKPLQLADAQRAWIVKRGHFDVFAIKRGATAGRRHHVLRAAAGDLLFGIDADAEQYALVAVGSLDGVAECGPVSSFYKTDMVDTWVERLCQAAAEPMAEWPDRVAAPGEVALAAGERLAADPRQVLWITVRSGTAQFLGQSPVGAMERIPLGAQAWVRADEDATIAIAPTGAADAMHMQAFNRLALRAIGARIERAAERDASAFSAGRAKNRQEFEAAMRDLAGAAAAKRKTRGADWTGDDLTIALGEVLAALHIKAEALAAARTIVVSTAAMPSVEERLESILHQLRLGNRRLVLKPGFWEHQGPPMLAWRRDDLKPMALVYRTGHGWQMIDGDGARTVDENTAGELSAEALQFYPNLPARPLQFRDLFIFGLADARPELTRLATTSIAIAILAVFIPIGTHYLVDTIIPNGQVSLLVIITGVLLVSVLCSITFEFLKSTALLRAESMFEARLEPSIIDRLIRLPTAFYRQYTVGDITDRALGIQRARETLSGNAASAVLGGVFGLVSLVPLFFYEKRLAFVALALTVVVCLTIVGLSFGQLRHEREEMRHRGRLEGFVLQMLVGITKLRAAAAESRGIAQWSRYFVAQRNRFVKARWWNAAQQIVMSVMPVLTTMTLYAAIAYLLKSDIEAMASAPNPDPTKLLSAADFIAFSAAFGQVMAALAGMTHSLTEMLVIVPLIERSQPIIASPIEMSEAAEHPGVLSGAIEFKNVKFRYIADGPLVLDDVSLRIEPGQFVAFVGSSGSGKSTMVRLLLGFEKPEAGNIFFGAKAADRIDMSLTRKQIGVVLQHGRISSGSIYDNIIGFGRLTLDDAWAAARMVGLDRDIESMPMGMHTVLMDGASTLSGGQRQRILIARALVRHPRILLFDEATSALDNRTQSIVTDTLGKLSTTRVVVAHRLSTIQAVDRIFVMERGRLVESGNYDELMSRNGTFAALAKRQML